jgi:hypothetical protein
MDFPDSVKLEAKRRANYCCVFCQQVGLFLEVHHIVRQEDGGTADITNAAPLCPNHHTLYDANPQLQRFVKEMRDFWWDQCAKRAAQPDVVALGQKLDALQASIKAGHQEVLGELKALVAGRFQGAADAASSASSMRELIKASTSWTGFAPTVTVTAKGQVTNPDQPSTHS